MNIGNLLLYAVTAVLIIISMKNSKEKTKKALIKAWKSFENILPQFLVVLLMVGVLLAILNPSTISELIGERSGWFGIILSALIGAITLIPGFVAFPTAALLLENGAGYMQIGAFISALMMVGIVTLPVEIKYFGKKMAILRNSLAFLFSFLVAIVMGVIMK